MRDSTTHYEISEDDFFARFKPVPNLIDPSGCFDGCMFETFGEELAHVRAQDRNFVWTILGAWLLPLSNAWMIACPVRPASGGTRRKAAGEEKTQE